MSDYKAFLAMLREERDGFYEIDEVAMDIIIEKLRPVFSQTSLGAHDPDIGFAVSMDFNPSESMGQNAALALLGKNVGHSGLN